MSEDNKIDLEPYPQTNLSNKLLKHQLEMLQFLYYTDYDIIYQTFQLKHAAYLQKRKGQVSTKFKSQEIARHFEIGSQKLHIRIMRDDIDLDRYLSKLQLLWHTRNIPFFHRYYFEKYIFTAHFKTLEQLIVSEEKLIRQQQHIYYSIFRAINARQACLRTIKRNLADLTSDDVYQYLHIAKQRVYIERRKLQKQKYQIQGYKVKQILDQNNVKLSKTKFQFFSDSFNHLSKLTLYVIELILKWREYIRSLTHDQRKQKQRIQYYFYDDNYFLKILSDLGFLRVSFLSNFYQFAPRNDPFMLRCILAFEKNLEKTLQHQLLKHIFLPLPQFLPDILSKLQFLCEEYKYNVRSRRVYDLKLLKPSYDLVNQKLNWNQPRQPISNLILKKLSPEKSKSLKTFRVRQAQKQQKIVVSFKNQKQLQKKRTTSIPGAREKLIVQTEDSPLKHSIIVQRNPIKDNMDQMMDSQLLKILKQQVIKKIRLDFKEQQRTHLSKNQALQMYIDNKVKDAIKGIFPYQPQNQIKLPIQFTTLSIPQDQVSTELTRVYKKSLSRFYDMQLTQLQLFKKIQASQYCYFVRATIGQEQIGRIVCTFDRQITQYKIIKILYIGFYDVSQLQLLMIKFVQFLWKYQNSYEVIYIFLLPNLNDTIKQLLSTLQQQLKLNCLVAIKQIYSNIAQYKFIFKRKHKNVNYIPNHYPLSFHANLYMLLSQQKLMLQNPDHHKLSLINYDYLLMEIIRKYINSDQFIILKQKISWKIRLKQILDNIISIQKDNNIGISISMRQASNITQLHKILSKQKNKLLEVSDLVKSNTIKLLKLQLILTLPYTMKSIYLDNNQQYYRCQIKDKINYWLYNNTQGYMFATNQKKDLKIAFFQAKEFIIGQKHSDQHISTYIQKMYQSEPIAGKQVEFLWIPMSRYPNKYQQRQDIYISTFRVQDLKSIKKQTLVADQFQWFCNMQMQNGIKFQKTKLDLILEKPLGIAVLAGDTNNVVYARIIT